MNDKLPQMTPYTRHVFFCTGQDCDPDGKATQLYEQLPCLLGDLGNYRNSARVKHGTTPCLGVCSGGPIVVVYPDGIWYHHVDNARLARIVEQHLRSGEPIQEWIFHKLPNEPEEKP